MSQSLCPDIVELARAVDIRAATEVAVSGTVHRVPAPSAGSGKAPLVEALKPLLYQRYCHASPPAAGAGLDLVGMRAFVARLSAANTGRGTWEPGWVMKEIDEDGRFGVARDGLTLWVHPGGFRPYGGAPPAPGVKGRLRIGKELREMMPGFYFAIGDGPADDAEATSHPVVRVYWHLTVEGAVPLIAALTEGLNALRVQFRAKVVSFPQSYGRADAGVLYLDRRAWARAFSALQEAHRRVRPWLRPAVPLMTRKLADGVAVADDPGTTESFGQHRTGLIAQALWEAHCSGADRLATVAETFVRHGVDPERPWLASGETTRYEPFEAPPPAGRGRSSSRGRKARS